MNSSLKLFGVIFLCVVLIVGLSFVPFHSALAQDAEGITIQKDVYLNSPIFAVEDLPAELTVSLYDAAGATAPIATQTFARGQYVMDFELSKSNGLEFGPIARLKVDFTNKLNLGDDPDNPTRVKEIWSELAVNSQPVGVRTRVSDETMVKLLLASDASLATYVTFAYEGDTNPLTTIYKGLPLASGLSAKEYISSLFTAVSPEGRTLGALTNPNNWFPKADNSGIYYTAGRVGIGTTNFPMSTDPERLTVVKGGGSEALAFTNYTATFFNSGSSFFGFRNTVSDVEGLFGVGGGSLASFTLGTWTNHPIDFVVNKNYAAYIATDGKVGIGTKSPAYHLAVNGSIGCKELTVTSTGWADFVFQDNYKLPPLEEVESFISENKHLPGIPPEKDVLTKGVNVGDMSAKLLQKIEELTLYLIELKKENAQLKEQIGSIQEQVGR